MAGDTGRQALRGLLPSEPAWLKQVHGTRVVEARAMGGPAEADGVVARDAAQVCAVMVADCMPVLFADEGASVVAAAHAGWRGLSAGVLEATLDALRVPPESVLAWLGPAIGPRAYEVGAEVRDSFLAQDGAAESAFVQSRPGHWLLDLYAVARQRLAKRGVTRIWGGGFCTLSDGRFHSYRRDRTRERMAAAIWMA